MNRNAVLIISSRSHHLVSLRGPHSTVNATLLSLKLLWNNPFIPKDKLSKSMLLTLLEIGTYHYKLYQVLEDCLLYWLKKVLSASDNFLLI